MNSNTAVDRTEVLTQALRSLDGTQAPFAGPRPRWQPHDSEWQPLEPVCEPRHGFLEIQRLRRSVHAYADRPVSSAHLHTICAAATAAEPGLQLLLIVRDVAGLEPGVYQYDDDAVRLIRPVPALSDEREQWVLQREFAHLPLLLVITGSLAQCGDSMHAYRDMMLRSGNMCQEAWLTAVSLGLAGVTFAGLLHAGITTLGVDGWERAGLVGLALGHERADQGAETQPANRPN